MKAFECRLCGTCCYGKGGIVVKEEEAARIAVFLHLDSEDFLARYCEEVHGRTYLRCGEDGYCVFFDRERMCLIHPVKPFRCALWPFFPANVNDPDAWELAKDACPGISRECSFEDFVAQARLEAPQAFTEPLLEASSQKTASHR